MIPDKIYLPVVEEEGKRLLCTIWWPEDNRSPNEKFVIDAIPYIRKDALLEWIQTELKLCESAVAMTRAYHKLIDKLNSM